MKLYKPVKDFAPGVRIAFSSVDDGSIAAGGGKLSTEQHEQNADKFLSTYFGTTNRAKVRVTYDADNTYTHCERVTSQNANQSIRSDALYTTLDEAVITLPVADCVATIVYDPQARMLGVLHLGRHSSVAGLIEEFAIEVADVTGSDPRDWHVWMSPSLRAPSDRMEYFTPPHPDQWEAYARKEADGKIHLDITGHNRERFERLGVQQSNIYVSPIDTYSDVRYFSQRAATEQTDSSRSGRMMVAAALTS